MAELLPDYEDGVELLKPFSRIRLLALDLDGTLHPSPLEEKVQVALRSLEHRYRVRVTLATGRTYEGVRGMCDRLGIRKGTPLVLYNGSVVVKHGYERLISRACISQNAASAVLKAASSFPCKVFVYSCQDATDVFGLDERLREEVLGWSFQNESEAREQVEFNGSIISWQEASTVQFAGTPSAIVIKIRQPTLTKTLTESVAAIPDLSVTRSGSVYIELRPPGSDKSVGLNCAARYLKIGQEQTLALGDNDNDVEMLEWAEIGVAIAGGSPAAIGHSDYVCRGTTFHGAVELLNVVRNAHRFYSGKQNLS